MFYFTSLLGAKSASNATQSLLELKGGVKVLIDVGWDETFNESLFAELEKHVPTLSFVLLTHATISHLGAYAHCCKHIPLFNSIPVYATTPVISLGRSFTQDLYKTAPQAASIIPQEVLAESTYSLPSLWSRTKSNMLRQKPSDAEIASYFTKIYPLKYSQPHQPLASPFSASLDGLTITAYNAGHTLGGTIWHIQHGMESLVYAVDWNQSREHVLASAAWLNTDGSEIIDGLRRPTALICGSRGSQRMILEGGRSKRDALLLEHIRTTISRGGTVLIPSDSSARVLELAYVLEQAWAHETRVAGDPESLRSARLYLATATGGATMRYARSMLEWMEEGIVREFESAGQRSTQGATSAGLPFDFKHLKVVERAKALGRLMGRPGPRVIIASDRSLDWGFSKGLLQSLASDHGNLIILTDRDAHLQGPGVGLGHSVWAAWLRHSGSENADSIDSANLAKTHEGSGEQITFRYPKTEQLLGDELTVYQQFLARQRQLANAVSAEKGTTLEIAVDAGDDQSSESSESSEESDTEHQGKAMNVSAAMTHARNKLGLTDAELGIDILIRRKGHHDYEVQGKKGREKTFPFVATKKTLRTDDFGDVIRPEDYLRAEEREDANGDEMQIDDGRKDNALGQKRKWGDVAVKPTANGINRANGTESHRRSAINGERLASPDPAGGASMAVDPVDQLADDGDMDNESEEDDAESQGPLKLVFEEEKVALNLRVAYIDFSGLHDKRSLQMLIPLIRPRKLILIGGNESETESLASDCDRTLNFRDKGKKDTEIFAPAVNATIDASVDTSAWMLRASKPFAKYLQWQTVRGLGIVALTGSMAAITLGSNDADGDQDDDDEASAKKKIKGEDGKSGNVVPSELVDDELADMPVIDNLPPSTLANASRSGGQALHVGDLRLAELRKLMQSAGFHAEFRGEGTLLVNGVVAVRKGGTGRLEVEGILDLPALGGPDPTFYDVRKKVYEGLAIVAGS